MTNKPIALTAVTLLLLISSCHAFDIGHHHDLTVSGLAKNGFAPDATSVVLIHNWFTDFYANFPIKEVLKELATLHFDNLLSSNEVSRS